MARRSSPALRHQRRTPQGTRRHSRGKIRSSLGAPRKETPAAGSKAPLRRAASFVFFLMRSSPAGHKWQKAQSDPLWQPFAFQNQAQGAQRPVECAAEPREGRPGPVETASVVAPCGPGSSTPLSCGCWGCMATAATVACAGAGASDVSPCAGAVGSAVHGVAATTGGFNDTAGAAMACVPRRFGSLAARSSGAAYCGVGCPAPGRDGCACCTGCIGAGCACTCCTNICCIGGCCATCGGC